MSDIKEMNQHPHGGGTINKSSLRDATNDVCSSSEYKMLKNIEIKGGLKLCKDLRVEDGLVYHSSGNSSADVVIGLHITRGCELPEAPERPEELSEAYELVGYKIQLTTPEELSGIYNANVFFELDILTPTERGRQTRFIPRYEMTAGAAEDPSDPYGHKKDFDEIITTSQHQLKLHPVWSDGTTEVLGGVQTKSVKYYMKSVRMGDGTGDVVINYNEVTGFSELYNGIADGGNSVASIIDLAKVLADDVATLDEYFASIGASMGDRLIDTADAHNTALQAFANSMTTDLLNPIRDMVVAAEGRITPEIQRLDAVMLRSVLGAELVLGFSSDPVNISAMAEGVPPGEDGDQCSKELVLATGLHPDFAAAKDWMVKAFFAEGPSYAKKRRSKAANEGLKFEVFTRPSDPCAPRGPGNVDTAVDAHGDNAKQRIQKLINKLNEVADPSDEEFKWDLSRMETIYGPDSGTQPDIGVQSHAMSPSYQQLLGSYALYEMLTGTTDPNMGSPNLVREIALAKAYYGIVPKLSVEMRDHTFEYTGMQWVDVSADPTDGNPDWQQQAVQYGPYTIQTPHITLEGWTGVAASQENFVDLVVKYELVDDECLSEITQSPTSEVFFVGRFCGTDERALAAHQINDIAGTGTGIRTLLEMFLNWSDDDLRDWYSLTDLESKFDLERIIDGLPAGLCWADLIMAGDVSIEDAVSSSFQPWGSDLADHDHVTLHITPDEDSSDESESISVRLTGEFYDWYMDGWADGVPDLSVRFEISDQNGIVYSAECLPESEDGTVGGDIYETIGLSAGEYTWRMVVEKKDGSLLSLSDLPLFDGNLARITDQPTGTPPGVLAGRLDDQFFYMADIELYVFTDHEQDEGMIYWSGTSPESKARGSFTVVETALSPESEPLSTHGIDYLLGRFMTDPTMGGYGQGALNLFTTNGDESPLGGKDEDRAFRELDQAFSDMMGELEFGPPGANQPSSGTTQGMKTKGELLGLRAMDAIDVFTMKFVKAGFEDQGIDSGPFLEYRDNLHRRVMDGMPVDELIQVQLEDGIGQIHPDYDPEEGKTDVPEQNLAIRFSASHEALDADLDDYIDNYDMENSSFPELGDQLPLYVEWNFQGRHHLLRAELEILKALYALYDAKETADVRMAAENLFWVVDSVLRSEALFGTIEFNFIDGEMVMDITDGILGVIVDWLRKHRDDELFKMIFNQSVFLKMVARRKGLIQILLKDGNEVIEVISETT